MSRSLTTAVKNELATNDIRPIHLITIGFDTPVNFTDCSFSLTSSVSGSSVTYNHQIFILVFLTLQKKLILLNQQWHYLCQVQIKLLYLQY
jgi:hypothetical protein